MCVVTARSAPLLLSHCSQFQLDSTRLDLGPDPSSFCHKSVSMCVKLPRHGRVNDVAHGGDGGPAAEFVHLSEKRQTDQDTNDTKHSDDADDLFYMELRRAGDEE